MRAIVDEIGYWLAGLVSVALLTAPPLAVIIYVASILSARPPTESSAQTPTQTEASPSDTPLRIANDRNAASDDSSREPRSPQWGGVRVKFLATHKECAACGTKKKLTVHHVLPFHLDEAAELDESNLITLCEQHHLIFGHLGDTRSWNPLVREDCKRYRAEVKARPYTREAAEKFSRQFQLAP